MKLATDPYQYTPQRRAAIREQVGLAMPMVHLELTSKHEDMNGRDYYYRVNHRCPLAVRCRDDRGPNAPELDVTFRHTEPAMIARGTYAPLELFLWFQSGKCTAGKLVDIYTMATRVKPPLEQREVIWNRPRWDGDETGFVIVTIDELRTTQALLRNGDGRNYQNGRLGAYDAVRRILDQDWDSQDRQAWHWPS